MKTLVRELIVNILAHTGGLQLKLSKCVVVNNAAGLQGLRLSR